MRVLLYSAAARRDVADILRYIARQSLSTAVAQKFVTALDDHCRKLARLPGTLGGPRPELRPGMRSSPFRGYVVFFQYVEDRLEVINILEAHRDVETYFEGL